MILNLFWHLLLQLYMLLSANLIFNEMAALYHQVCKPPKYMQLYFVSY